MDNSLENPPPSSPPHRRALIALAALVAITVLLSVGGRKLAALLPEFAFWVAGLGAWGALAFGAGYVAATLAFVPGSLLTLAAGALFGLGRGTALVFVCATLGASIAFLIARHLARQAIERRLAGNRRFAAIDRAVGRDGLRTVFLLRLSPVVPFNLLNYALGLTGVRFRDFLLASIGMLPGTFLYVYLGHGLGSLAALASGAEVKTGRAGPALFALGLAATVAVTVLVTRAARRALAEATEPETELEAAATATGKHDA